jgi:hypothetical protein
MFSCYRTTMHSLARLQLIGPAALFAATLAADSFAYALVWDPSSSLLWYLNLEVFSIFRASRALLGGLFAAPFAQVLIVGLPLITLAGIGLVWKRNLMIALSSNLSFVYAMLLLFAWHNRQSIGNVTSTSLAWVHVPSGSTLGLFATLLLVSFFSFAASHVLYIRAARRRA